MNQTIIIAILVKDRIKEAGKTLNVLAQNADIICNRLGFHEVTDNVCSRVGVIILHIKGGPEKWQNLLNDLSLIGGIEVKTMLFN
ncbi:MAG: hypothetical protein PHT69_03765 [Bacteroidales bacterium]|nr:hypothetical protein [Bacteroidales bacterium]